MLSKLQSRSPEKIDLPINIVQEIATCLEANAGGDSGAARLSKLLSQLIVDR